MLAKGFEFNPSGEDLINFYLYPWVKQQVPWNGIPAKEIYGPLSDPIPLQSLAETNELTSCSQPEDAYGGVFVDLTPLLSSSETNELIRDLRAENGCRTGSGIPIAQQPMADTNELTWCTLVENGDFNVSGVHAQLHGNGSDTVSIRPPQITQHAAVGDGSDDPSFYPTDDSVQVGPVASKKRAPEVRHLNEEDREGVLKRQKTLMPEHYLMDDDEEEEEDEEPSFATKLVRLLLSVNGMKPS